MKKLSRSTRAFTLVEIMIVVAIVALLAAIAVPGILRARKRSQASLVLNDLRMIEAAIDQFAIEHHQVDGAPVAVDDWKNYIKPDSPLHATGKDMFGFDYGPQIVGRLPRVHVKTKMKLADVVGDEFWLPYTATAPSASDAGSTVDRAGTAARLSPISASPR